MGGAARVVAPGRIINRELEARGWSQKDLSEIMGRPVQAVNEIIGGTKQITPITAHELAEAFGTSPELWMNLETNYRLHSARRNRSGGEITRRSKIYGIAPVKEIVKRGWIEAPANIEDLENRICSFLDIKSPEDEPEFELAVSRRNSIERGPTEAAQIAMLKRAKRLAASQRVPRFNLKKFRDSISELLALAKDIEGAAKVPATLNRLGVRFVIVPQLPQSFLDGAAFSSEGSPVILLTLRYDRIDNFWFTLLHEAAHAYSGHKGIFIDNNLEQKDKVGGEERAADKLAGEWLIDEGRYKEFVKSEKPLFPRQSITRFAYEIDRHPGIVLGRLHHDGFVPYSRMRGMLEKVRPALAEWIDAVPD